MAGNSNNLRSLFVATTSFLGGIAIGFLLTDKKGDKSSNLVNKWLDREVPVPGEGTYRPGNLRSSIRKKVENNIPDPYKAAEEIELRDSKILGI